MTLLPRLSHHQSPITTATTLQETPTPRLEDLTPKSIIFGENGISQHLFQIQEDLYEYSENHKKKIFVGTLNGIDHECIARYFPVDFVERYIHEKNNYLLLLPSSSRYFAKMLAFGDIILSGRYRNGHIIIFIDLEITWEEDRNRPADEWEVNMILGTELTGKGC